VSELTEHARRNRQAWTGWAPEFVEPGRRAWAGEEAPSWGIWSILESELGVLPDVAGKDVVELGCGTAYWSAWLARMGARAVGVDVTPAQLETARRFMAEYGPDFSIVEASAEAVPLPDMSFDLALSEYGASIWCDPHLWIPEAARLLRPGGELVFLIVGTIFALCEQEEDGVPAGDRLLRDYFGMHRIEWPNDPSVGFSLGYGDWIRLLRGAGFDVVDLVEVQAPEGATTRFDYVTPEWARRWPSEEIWRARKIG
jgi:SAM-dependent methyltransferase